MIEKIGDITKRIVDIWKTEDKNREIDIDVLWNRIIDDNLQGHTYVKGMKNNILYIKVDSSCYLSLLNMKKKEILKKIKDNGFSIKKIVVKL